MFEDAQFSCCVNIPLEGNVDSDDVMIEVLFRFDVVNDPVSEQVPPVRIGIVRVTVVNATVVPDGKSPPGHPVPSARQGMLLRCTVADRGARAC